MTVTATGPIFNGQADRLATLACAEIEKNLAQQAATMVLSNLGSVLQHPTGYYESQIDAEPGGGGWEVNDGGVIYGPWLEGVGSRNRTTRFKGYATFRRTYQEFERIAGDRAQLVAAPYIQQMG